MALEFGGYDELYGLNECEVVTVVVGLGVAGGCCNVDVRINGGFVAGVGRIEVLLIGAIVACDGLRLTDCALDHDGLCDACSDGVLCAEP